MAPTKTTTGVLHLGSIRSLPYSTLYTVKIDDRTYITFDKELYDEAVGMKGERVCISYYETNRLPKLTGIELLASDNADGEG